MSFSYYSYLKLIPNTSLSQFNASKLTEKPYGLQLIPHRAASGLKQSPIIEGSQVCIMLLAWFVNMCQYQMQVIIKCSEFL